jgi:hypothetical protein
MREMSSKRPSPPAEDQPSQEAERFDKVMRELFKVDRRDVAEHVPVKRERNQRPRSQ